MNLIALEEALLLGKSRLLLADPDLLQGTVVQISTASAAGQSRQRVWLQCGAEATVCKYQTRSGSYKALRFFHGKARPQMQSHYAHLAASCRAHPDLSDIMASFAYYTEGIWTTQQVRGRTQQVTHPVLVMDWVEGGTLLERVHALCRQGDRNGLGKLAAQWVALLKVMEQCGCAHGDLAGTNIMLRADGRLVLIDYDQVYVPNCQGHELRLKGQPDYQHPQWGLRRYDARMDDFARHVIFLALRALQVDPSLWQTYGTQGVVDTQLLFTHEDFHAPASSPLFAALERMDDPVVVWETSLLKQACTQSLATMHLPPLPLEDEGAFVAWVRTCTTSALQLAVQIGSPRAIVAAAEGERNVLKDPALATVVAAAQHQVLQQSQIGQVWAQWSMGRKEICLEWEWPEDPLIQFAAVAWRSDRWPRCAQERGTYLHHPVRRQPGQRRGRFTFRPGEHTHLYICVYGAFPVLTPNALRLSWMYASPYVKSALECKLLVHDPRCSTFVELTTLPAEEPWERKLATSL